jgi:PiT family inorganic phosphate transporter
MNDGQKFMGAFTLALVMGGIQKGFHIPLWVILLCAVVMAIGTMVGGWKIIHTMGTRMTPLKTHEGFAAETAAATTIVLASHYGIPLSTTHTIGTSIMGVGSARGIQAVRWRVAGEIVTAWIITFPICGAISFLTVKLAMLFR